jgi:hypothetical protein
MTAECGWDFAGGQLTPENDELSLTQCQTSHSAGMLAETHAHEASMSLT